MPQLTLDQAFQLAVQHHQANRLAEAEQLYRQILQHSPDNSFALGLLGILCGQTGRQAAAIDLLRRAISLTPGTPSVRAHLAQCYGHLGQCLLATGQRDQAAEAFRQAMAFDPDNHEIQFNLGSIHASRGDHQQAIACYQQALRLKEDYYPAHLDLGWSYMLLGRYEEALAHTRRAVELNPASADALTNLGIILEHLGQIDEAIRCHQGAIRLAPRHAAAHQNLGAVLQQNGQLADAEASYRRAIDLRPDYHEAWNNLSLVLLDGLRLDDAETCARKAIELRPDAAAAHNNLASILQQQWRLAECIEERRRALAIQPAFVGAHSNLLLNLHYVEPYDPPAVFAEHLHWARQHACDSLRLARPHNNRRDPGRRLRIGYLAPDLRQNSIAFFIEPILANHDHERFEILWYTSAVRTDAAAQRRADVADHSRPVLGRSDQQVAEMIRADAIDILIDLAGHTADSRLLVLACKPAPVQMTYLGYPDTTGLPTVDYRITDALADPPGTTEAFHTERLLRLDGCFLCYQPVADAPDPAEPPAKARGHITFGCFNYLGKVTQPALRLWALLLDRVPGSRLVLKDRGFACEKTRKLVSSSLAMYGVELRRVDLLGPDASHRGHLGMYQCIDVALDTFPYCGTTTTCEALWMGVPVVSLAGAAHVSRVGCSLLNAVGLPELVANTSDQYIQITADLAGDADKLAALRAGLRERMQQSPLVDGPAFTRRLEAAYRQAWAQWCSGATP